MTKIDYEVLYGNLHRVKPKLLSGQSIVRERRAVGKLIQYVKFYTPDPRILDYGSGKGHQYLVNRIHEEWDVRLPYCYDIGIAGLRERPQGMFDGIICNDVLEHIHPDDVDEILEDIFSFIKKEKECFVYLGIDTRPARKVFVGSGTDYDGQQVHLSIREPEWWEDRIAKYRALPITIETAYYDE